MSMKKLKILLFLSLVLILNLSGYARLYRYAYIFLEREPFFNLTIENQTNKKLAVSIDRSWFGILEPGQETTQYQEFMSKKYKFPIEAIDPNGDTIFLKKLGWLGWIQRIALTDVKVIIPSSAHPIIKPGGGVSSNGVNLNLVSINKFSPGGAVTVAAQTVPNAHVILWVVNPISGTRSAYPADHEHTADAQGNVSWGFTISPNAAEGPGHIEFYVTTSTDSTFLAAFDAYAQARSTSLDNYFPSQAANIADFKSGLVPLLVLDDYTTLLMFPQNWTFPEN